MLACYAFNRDLIPNNQRLPCKDKVCGVDRYDLRCIVQSECSGCCKFKI
jgi:hypothetical protein